MASLNLYTFNNTDRIGSDSTDQTQDNVSNIKYANHTLTDHFSKFLSDDHVNFATQQPTLSFNGLTNGNGIGGNLVESESSLLLKTEQERPLEKLQLFQRPLSHCSLFRKR